ncbi:MAG: HEAT repeat domain-containing protein [Thermoguttaceae bacterium]|jgi:HEAT repeat protein
MSRNRLALLVLASAVLGIPVTWLSAADAPTATPSASADEVLSRLSSFRIGGDCAAIHLAEDLVRNALTDPQAKATLARKLAEMLRRAEVTLDAKRFICRQLRIIADAPEVAALAALLADADLSDMARYALERIPGRSAAKAMLAALPKASPSQKVGLINSLGDRGEAQAVGELAALLDTEDEGVARAAISALANIGTVEAAGALEKAKVAASEKAKPLFTKALLLCADRLAAQKKFQEAENTFKRYAVASEKPPVRIVAARGLLLMTDSRKWLPRIVALLSGNDAVLQLMVADEARQIPDAEVTKVLAEILPRLPAYSQLLVLGVLADRRDRVAMSAVLSTARSKDDAIAIAALVALGQIGDASLVPFLAQQAVGADIAKIEAMQPKEGSLGGAMVSIVPFVDFSRGNAARSSLITLKASETDAAILKVFQTADARTKAMLADVMAARLSKGAIPALLGSAADKDEAVRFNAMKALGVLATEKEMPALVQFYLRAATATDRTTAENALRRAARHIEDRNRRPEAVLAAYAGATPPTKILLLELLGQMVCPKSLEAIRAALKDDSNEVYAAAVRTLANWPESGVVPDLLDLAKTARTSDLRLIALRGYLRLAGMAADDSRKMEMYRQAAKLIQRGEEKRLLLSGLGDVGTAAALKMVEPYLNDESLKEEAAAATVLIAEKLSGSNLAQARSLMKRVLEIAKDRRLRDRAQAVIDRP